MTSMFTRILVIGALLSSFMAVAQTGSASQPAAPLPSAPSSASANEPIVATGNKVATINITGALANCNEGQRDFGVLDKKFEPRQTELSNMNKELEGLKTQLNAASTETARAPLVKQIEQKQKLFDRTRQDAADEYTNQQNEVASRILAKMAPVMVKYAADNGFGVLIDTTKQWPDGQVIWSSPQTVDITRAVVDTYNTQSGVPAPPAAAKPAGSTAAPRTTTPPATKPPTGTTPK
ncbi:MAG TPA: OmpH family outer membrane protein [Terriglobales bacterium]|nr:OmpH family outer membrane protein [Terriglobales bacterium]